MATRNSDAPKQFKRKAVLAKPLLRFHDDVPLFVKIVAAFREGPNVDAKGKEVKEPPVMADVINLETGEECQITIAAKYLPAFRVKEVIERAFPKQSYIGKSFELMRKSKPDDQRYNDYVVAEIEAQ